jgi:hypothetical protein
VAWMGLHGDRRRFDSGGMGSKLSLVFLVL